MSEVAADDARRMRVNWRAAGMFALFAVLISGMVIAADVFSVRDRNLHKRRGWFVDSRVVPATALRKWDARVT